MSLANKYQRIAHRSIEASAELLGSDYHEKATFMTYHAYESTGSAFVEYFGVSVSKAHPKKIAQFALCMGRVNRNQQKTIGQLNIILGNLRNDMLYPSKNGQAYLLPEECITASRAKHLSSRVAGVVKFVDKWLE